MDMKNEGNDVGLKNSVPVLVDKEETVEAPQTSQMQGSPTPEKLVIDKYPFQPLIPNFEAITSNSDSRFPYKWLLYGGNHSETLQKVIKPRGYARVSNKEDEHLEEINFIWRPIQFSSRYYMRIDKTNSSRDPKNHIVINHLDNIKGICTKTGLIKSLRRYYKEKPEAIMEGYNVYDSTPTTFLVLPDCNDAEFQNLVKRFQELADGNFRKEKIPPKHCADNVWLIKPAAENQGRGIEIFKNNLPEMKRFLSSKNPNSYWVVQKYLEKPLLYYGRKFDIRMWAVMTWRNELYFYPHGYIRTSSDNYTLDSKLNYVHLTNNCLQVHGEKYGAFEEGNTMGFEVLEKYLKEQYPDYALDFKEHILARIKDMMIDSFLSVKSELNACKRKNCFELLGFDFMIDEDFRVWLIEVNTNPYLGVPNKYIDGLLSKMLTDLFALVLDPSVKPANDIPSTPNLYELLYDDRRKVNQRRSFNTPIYPIPELAQPQIQQMSLLSKIKRKKTHQNTVPSKPKKVKKAAEKPSKVQEEPKPKERVPIIIPIKPRKRLVDEAKELSEQFDEVRFGTYSKRVLGCFSNWDLIPQMDITDTSNSILILIGGKAQEIFISSPLFCTLCRLALDFNKEMPREIRRVLFDKIVLVSQELRTRGHLVQKEIVQGLIEISLLSCEIEDKIQLSGHIEDDRYFIKEAFRTLYNLAYFDRPRLYIPGETKMHNYNRKKTISWGCLSALYYIKQKQSVLN